MRWYAQAAKLGHAGAQVNLGISYLVGEGTKQDFAKARKLFRAASDQGDPKALFGLAHMHEQGKGVPLDLCHAVRLYGQAAALGSQKATERLRKLGRPTHCRNA